MTDVDKHLAGGLTCGHINVGYLSYLLIQLFNCKQTHAHACVANMQGPQYTPFNPAQLCVSCGDTYKPTQLGRQSIASTRPQAVPSAADISISSGCR